MIKNEKKIVGAISELPAKEHSQSSPTSIFSAYFLYYLIKNPKTTIALKFLTHNISGIVGVTYARSHYDVTDLNKKS